jgi:hypothetical protein
MVRVELAGPRAVATIATIAGESVQLLPAGRPEQEKRTASLYPFLGVADKWNVAASPPLTVALVGVASSTTPLTAIVNSGEAEA